MKTIIGLFVIGSLVLGLSGIPTSEAVVYDVFKITAIITFEHSGTLNQIKNAYENDVRPVLVSKLLDFKTTNNITTEYANLETTEDSVWLIGFNPETGKNIYQIYPKVYGANLSTPLTEDQFHTAWSNFVGELRQPMATYLQNNGATNATSYLQYHWGDVTLDEPF